MLVAFCSWSTKNAVTTEKCGPAHGIPTHARRKSGDEQDFIRSIAEKRKLIEFLYGRV